VCSESMIITQDEGVALFTRCIIASGRGQYAAQPPSWTPARASGRGSGCGSGRGVRFEVDDGSMLGSSDATGLGQRIDEPQSPAMWKLELHGSLAKVVHVYDTVYEAYICIYVVYAFSLTKRL